MSALTVVIGLGLPGQNQKDRPYGVLGTASTRPLNFEPEDLQFLQSLANVIASAHQRNQAEIALLEREAQLRQAQKMESIGRLAGGIAHDFNNLLTVINGYSELLLMSVGEAGLLYPDLLEINRAGQLAASLTRQLLAFSRQQVLQPSLVNLNGVVADTDKLLHRVLREDVALVTRLDPSLGEVLVDAGQIEQVLLNLAVNACDAMPVDGADDDKEEIQTTAAEDNGIGGEGGIGSGGTGKSNGGRGRGRVSKLTIETSNVELDETYRSTAYPVVKSGQYVMLAVSDTGTGMDKATLEKIFEPFFTTKGPGKGTGLGLSTVYGIVKQSEGYIWVYSEVGIGTTFKIYLPRVISDQVVGGGGGGEKEVAGSETVTATAARRITREVDQQQTIDTTTNANSSGSISSSRATTHKARSRGRVLVVEDDVLVRDLIKRVLEEAGYRVEEAGNGEEALALLEEAITNATATAAAAAASNQLPNPQQLLQPNAIGNGSRSEKLTTSDNYQPDPASEP